MEELRNQNATSVSTLAATAEGTAVLERPTEAARAPRTEDAERTDETAAEPKKDEGSEQPTLRITVTENGPYLVNGGVPLSEEVITPVGGHMEYRTSRTMSVGPTYALCRCGHSSTPPFCDGAHLEAHFNGTEKAPRDGYEERADVLPGRGVFLLDDNRCAFARFCHREDGDVWSMTERSGNPRIKHEAIKASSECPSGRLVHVDAQDGTVYEPQLKPHISFLQDPQKNVSGPLFVRGGVTLIGADGTQYELRNRYALCRCGASHNKPFCDAVHVSVEYHDGSAR